MSGASSASGSASAQRHRTYAADAARRSFANVPMRQFAPEHLPVSQNIE